ncbi:TPA: DUF551 domain-containing protein [Enterobacter asburiae]
MSPITKEFTKERVAEIIHAAGLEPCDYEEVFGSIKTGEIVAMARIALASLEAEASGRNPVLAYADSYRNMANHGVESIPVWSVITDLERNIAPLFTAPPAPISVPAAMEMDDDFDSAFEHGKAVGWNAYRAAMLQGADGNAPAHFRSRPAQSSLSPAQGGNSQVIPDGWVACSERMPETMVSVLVTGTWFHHSVAFWDGLSWCDLDFEQPVTHWMPLPAAPQQEA